MQNSVTTAEEASEERGEREKERIEKKK